MIAILHTILLGQSGNDGCRKELIKGFATKEEAQKFIDENCEHNGWHSYKIVNEVHDLHDNLHDA